MRSSAVGPDRAVDRSSAPPPRAANLYACHEVMGATACRPFRVIHDRFRRAENRSMSAVPRKRRKVRALASVAKGHGDSRREPLQRPAMVVWFAVQSPEPRLRLSAAFRR